MSIEIRRGTSAVLRYACTNQDGSVRDITDATIEFNAYPSPTNQAEPELTKDGTVVDGEAGQAAVTLEPADTSGWSHRVLWYEVRLTTVEDQEYVVGSGKLTVSV